MHTEPTIEPAGSPVSGVIPEAALSLARRNPPSKALAKLLSVIRGDKYMVDAYAPAWHSAAGAHEDSGVQNHDSELAAQSAPRVSGVTNERKLSHARSTPSTPVPFLPGTDGAPGRRVLALRHPVGERGRAPDCTAGD
jgi:hypothetical protein